MRLQRNTWMSARSKRRHPCEKGSLIDRAWRQVLQALTDHRLWARHPEPFNKTSRGKARRAEKRWKERQRAETHQ